MKTAEVNVQSVPTMKGLRHYLDYQYPASRGDLELTRFCNELQDIELKAFRAGMIYQRKIDAGIVSHYRNRMNKGDLITAVNIRDAILADTTAEQLKEIPR